MYRHKNVDNIFEIILTLPSFVYVGAVIIIKNKKHPYILGVFFYLVIVHL